MSVAGWTHGKTSLISAWVNERTFVNANTGPLFLHAVCTVVVCKHTSTHTYARSRTRPGTHRQRASSVRRPARNEQRGTVRYHIMTVTGAQQIIQCPLLLWQLRRVRYRPDIATAAAASWCRVGHSRQWYLPCRVEAHVRVDVDPSRKRPIGQHQVVSPRFMKVMVLPSRLLRLHEVPV